MRLLYLILLISFFFSCKENNSQQQVDIRNEQFVTYYAIYFTSDSISKSLVKSIAEELISDFKVVEELSDIIEINEVSMTRFSNLKEDFPPPTLDYLSYSARGLSQSEMQAVQNAKSAILLGFSGGKTEVINSHISINSFIDTLLASSNAIVTDYTTLETFNRQSWQEMRIKGFSADNNDITTQITIHLYREDEFCRAVTLGMGKFCLPDISIKNLSCSDQNTYGSLINLLSQTMLESALINEDFTVQLNIEAIENESLRNQFLSGLEENAQKLGLATLKMVDPQEGDDNNTQLQIIFNNKDFSTPQEEQKKLLSEIFGATDKVDYITHNDELLAASEKARKELPRLKELINKGLPPGYSVLLKAPFKTDDGGNEWMWVEVTNWKDEGIKGILQNDPFEVSNLKAGAIVSISQGDIFDYILNKPDGSFEGNETEKIIEKSQ